MTFAEAGPADVDSTQQEIILRVLTVNTHKGFNAFNRRFILHELRDAVRATSADLVFLQEVHGEHQLHAERNVNWPTAPQYEFLADSMWPAFAYGRNAVYPEGHHGNALISRLPISSYDNHDISIAGNEQRGLLHARIDLPGPRALHAICVHLGLRERQRQSQLQLLCKLVAGVPPDAPLVVAGDFNDWRCRAGAILADCGLLPAFRGGGEPRSFPARWPVLRLDRIYVRNLRVNSSQVLNRRPWPHLSDHLPLLAEVVP
ncbi:endonuclease/exonuclease/phosphatase family protein [Pseudomonas sp. ZM23]|uniref:Endonuclease/exonuclease/phosphatase family protein n=1 Tax=Pseudomonas triclosanedens TaxID=2961893 RepID=A0ABY7A608_9PSED|nr:endonuclease/exonuclease/phosphatase family protein [Pseudomonas triclosanedens]MCP8466257.1 endonuclease/exonuclease/phosphatase family protein [Pseudomonas triclosanedens]MCP8471783.1 endonuclease/exonuclease/phosphatase family protein [Pseudomonas triclosanedens]MCP8478478.1 endonuclease/exonuclease/phosphatase family protein [Pseudomonas triclosanedens]WAI52325.1 endonuclease/exonuclease/phosphatase family protein [Pseudomonas triclosanedens]